MNPILSHNLFPVTASYLSPKQIFSLEQLSKNHQEISRNHEWDFRVYIRGRNYDFALDNYNLKSIQLRPFNGIDLSKIQNIKKVYFSCSTLKEEDAKYLIKCLVVTNCYY